MRCDPFVNDYILYRKGNRLKHLLGSGLVDGAAEHVFHIVHNGFFKGGLVKFHRIHRILLLTFQIRPKTPVSGRIGLLYSFISLHQLFNAKHYALTVDVPLFYKALHLA